jgi:hypothetical protein
MIIGGDLLGSPALKSWLRRRGEISPAAPVASAVPASLGQGA